jgi:hypothetical protein
LIAAVAGVIQEKAILELIMARAAVARGVRNPAMTSAPAPISTAGNNISGLRVGTNSDAPWAIAREPAARRKTSRPTPGKPEGNVEKNRRRRKSSIRG